MSVAYWGCEDVKKGCRAKDLTGLGVFQGLQRACNAYIDAHPGGRYSKLDVDGRLGKLTYDLVVAILLQEGPPSWTSMAGDSDYYAAVIANMAGVAPDFTPDPKYPEDKKLPRGSGKVDLPDLPPPGDLAPPLPSTDEGKSYPPAASSLAWLWWTIGIVAVAGAGFAGYAIWRKKKGKPLFGANILGKDDDADDDDEDDDRPAPFSDYIDV